MIRPGLKHQLISCTVQPKDRLNPLWKVLFDGCSLNRATDKWILEGFEWAETKRKSNLLTVFQSIVIAHEENTDSACFGRDEGGL